MSNITLRDGGHVLRALLEHSPTSAARHGVLHVMHDALCQNKAAWLADELVAAAAPLATVLDVPDIHAIDGALRAIRGRAPAAVTRALLSPELIAVLCDGLDSLGLLDLRAEVVRWGPRGGVDSADALPLAADARQARAQLLGQLQQRASELLAEWYASGTQFGVDLVHVDGRSLLAAARVWQVPMITGTVPSPPQAASALHPNRLGRTATALTYSRLPALFHSVAPIKEIFEALALLVAVGEAISVPVEPTPEREGPIGMMRWDQDTARQSVRGELPVRVRVGEPIGEESKTVDYWWPVFSSWGSTSKRLATAIPTAWRLSNVEADVLVWALCSVAARISIAASAAQPQQKPYTLGGPVERLNWEEHFAAEFPGWEVGAQSVWSLMQQQRRFADRTQFPGLLVPVLGNDQSWPWPPQN
jgi:hypothetical protein